VPLKLVKRPKSPNWIIRGSLRRVRVEESTGTSNKNFAEEIRAKREAEILTEGVYGKLATMTFAHAAVSYLENGGSGKFLRYVLEYFGTRPLSQIDQEAIDRGARKLFPNASAATRNRQFYTPTSAVLHHAARRKWCPAPLIERPHGGKERVRWLNIEEANRLLDHASDHFRPLLVFLFYTGARVGEALWLDWRDLDLDSAHVTFRRTKNGEARGVPLHPRLLAKLRTLPHHEGRVFRRPDGNPYQRPTDGSDVSAGSRISTAFRGACRRAGITDFHPHDCRHTWAPWHYAANRDLGALQRLGGWKSVRMVMRYAHINVAELSHTIDRLPGGNFGEPKQAKAKTS
jgi:integrase